MRFFDFFKVKKDIRPEEYGWSKKNDDYYEKRGYILYKGSTGWVLDKTSKNAPGIISRFGETLTIIDMEEADGIAENVLNPTRRRSHSA